jgi:hypothetical protein
MGSTVALVVECAVVSCTVLGAGVLMVLLHQSFTRSELSSKGRNGHHAQR